jgi:hypothetical protein
MVLLHRRVRSTVNLDIAEAAAINIGLSTDATITTAGTLLGTVTTPALRAVS